MTFALGALLPLLPWFVAGSARAAALSLLLAGGGAVAVGGVLGHLTDGRVVRSALRQLLVVTLGSGVTFLVGKLFGTAVS